MHIHFLYTSPLAQISKINTTNKSVESCRLPNRKKKMMQPLDCSTRGWIIQSIGIQITTGWGKVQNELIYPDRANLAKSG